MMAEHRRTPEEEVYGQLVDELWEGLSEQARTLLGEAQRAAYAAYMVYNCCYQWHFEYDEAMDRIRLAAAGLTDHEHKLLAKLWHAALAAAASVDANDYETLTGYRVYRGNLHRYYRMLSGMVEEVLGKILLERREAELQRKMAEREAEEFWDDIPF